MSKPGTANQCIFHNWVNLYTQFCNLYIVTVIWVISYSPMMLFLIIIYYSIKWMTINYSVNAPPYNN